MSTYTKDTTGCNINVTTDRYSNDQINPTDIAHKTGDNFFVETNAPFAFSFDDAIPFDGETLSDGASPFDGGMDAVPFNSHAEDALWGQQSAFPNSALPKIEVPSIVLQHPLSRALQLNMQENGTNLDWDARPTPHNGMGLMHVMWSYFTSKGIGKNSAIKSIPKLVNYRPPPTPSNPRPRRERPNEENDRNLTITIPISRLTKAGEMLFEHPSSAVGMSIKFPNQTPRGEIKYLTGFLIVENDLQTKIDESDVLNELKSTLDAQMTERVTKQSGKTERNGPFPNWLAPKGSLAWHNGENKDGKNFPFCDAPHGTCDGVSCGKKSPNGKIKKMYNHQYRHFHQDSDAARQMWNDWAKKNGITSKKDDDPAIAAQKKKDAEIKAAKDAEAQKQKEATVAQIKKDEINRFIKSVSGSKVPWAIIVKNTKKMLPKIWKLIASFSSKSDDSRRSALFLDMIKEYLGIQLNQAQKEILDLEDPESIIRNAFRDPKNQPSIGCLRAIFANVADTTPVAKNGFAGLMLQTDNIASDDDASAIDADASSPGGEWSEVKGKGKGKGKGNDN
jgi:hypothetical protein